MMSNVSINYYFGQSYPTRCQQPYPTNQLLPSCNANGAAAAIRSPSLLSIKTHPPSSLIIKHKHKHKHIFMS